MTNEEMRVAIAEVCKLYVPIIGNFDKQNNHRPECQCDRCIPNYPEDLNAMHSVEKVLFESNDWSACRYEELLAKATSHWPWHATAAQRAEAFLRTIGKWRDDEPLPTVKK